MLKEFNNLEELEPYYDKKTNTYNFKEAGKYIDVKLNFNLDVHANISAVDIDARNINAYDIKAGDINAGYIDAGDIDAGDINAYDIKAYDIKAGDINAWNINARNINARNIKAGDIDAGVIIARDINADDIEYYAVCVSFINIICKSIQGERNNCIHKALDGEIIIKEKGDK